jgi:hypothetical protein
MSSSLTQPSRAPGVTFEARRPSDGGEPLRTDVAGVILRCERGPVGEHPLPVRVTDPRSFARVFGAEEGGTSGVGAVNGYFENGGQVLWVVRVAASPAAAHAALDVSAAAGWFGSVAEDGTEIFAQRLEVRATSPGAWGNALQVALRLRRGGTPGGTAAAELIVRRDGEVQEHLTGLDPARIVDEVSQKSALVSLAIDATLPARSAIMLRDAWFPFDAASPGVLRWQGLQQGAAAAPSLADYQVAAAALCDEPEPAILFAPDARADLGGDATDFYAGWADRASRSLDRMVLVDPSAARSGAELRVEADDFRGASTGDPARDGRFPCAAALYFPHVLVADPRGRGASPTRTLPPSGHVAGLYARLDRERGAHHSPANAALVGAVDLDREYDEQERAGLNRAGLNALRCSRGRGVEVWGSRTLHLEEHRRFVAHRRLIHRLVRAMRRAGDPLVFDVNTPVLRLTLVRTITSVLLEAFRAGALKGATPEEAFRVACDDNTNPPGAYDNGVCIAEVSLAPAAPMEFIHLKISLSRDGSLEALE